mmetsp:Transcript_10443/g.20268  ORF Transcript_10443/g.20268 Transcript_10443/m.20268 type:complete len:217 (+) Transcript_10443:23-673(+)
MMSFHPKQATVASFFILIFGAFLLAEAFQSSPWPAKNGQIHRLQERRRQSVVKPLQMASVIGTATDSDLALISKIMRQELMNPLFLSKENFMVMRSGHTEEIEAFGQIRPVGKSDYELASVYVMKSCRQEGKGSEVVGSLLESFYNDKPSGSNCALYVLTLGRTAPFFCKLGFRQLSATECKSIPVTLQAEMALGQLVSKLVKGSVVCLVHERSTS